MLMFADAWLTNQMNPSSIISAPVPVPPSFENSWQGSASGTDDVASNSSSRSATPDSVRSTPGDSSCSSATSRIRRDSVMSFEEECNDDDEESPPTPVALFRARLRAGCVRMLQSWVDKQSAAVIANMVPSADDAQGEAREDMIERFQHRYMAFCGLLEQLDVGTSDAQYHNCI